MATKILASKVIDIALNEELYLEKASANNLDSKLANAGDKNYTKYSRDLVKLIGSPYAQGVAWCDIFVDWCFIQAYGKDTAKKLLGGWSAYTPTSAQYFKNMNQWSSTPSVGAIIFFRNDVRICHTGIVYKVDATKVYTIEGNTASQGTDVVVPNGGGVFKKSYLLTNPAIAGYGVPKYDKEDEVIIPVKPSSKYTYGMDISANQGNVDFSLVKASGVQFAVLRSTTANGQPDVKFEQYYKGIMTYGIAPACYKYSYAKTEQEAIAEAWTVLKLLGNRKIAIWYDLENANQVLQIGKAGIERVANAFLSTCILSGYGVGIYCNLNWYKNYISAGLKKRYTFWIARYGKNNGQLDEQYKPNVGEQAWQYTSHGHVDGIQGNVDLDVIYK